MIFLPNSSKKSLLDPKSSNCAFGQIIKYTNNSLKFITKNQLSKESPFQLPSQSMKYVDTIHHSHKTPQTLKKET